MCRFIIAILVLSVWSLTAFSVGRGVSVEQLITKPEKYNKVKVNVIGYIRYDEGYPYLILFNSMESAKLNNLPNSISLINKSSKGILSEYCSNRYVELTGLVKVENSRVYVEVEDYIQAYNKDMQLAYRTCEPTGNQIKPNE